MLFGQVRHVERRVLGLVASFDNLRESLSLVIGILFGRSSHIRDLVRTLLVSRLDIANSLFHSLLLRDKVVVNAHSPERQETDKDE